MFPCFISIIEREGSKNGMKNNWITKKVMKTKGEREEENIMGIDNERMDERERAIRKG